MDRRWWYDLVKAIIKAPHQKVALEAAYNGVETAHRAERANYDTRQANKKFNFDHLPKQREVKRKKSK